MNFANFSEVHVRVCIHILLHDLYCDKDITSKEHILKINLQKKVV